MLDFVFRLDANESVGAGHLMRSIAIIEALRRRKCCVAIQGEVSERFSSQLKILAIPCFSTGIELSAKCLVIDSYQPLLPMVASYPANYPIVLFEDEMVRCSDRALLVVSAFGDRADLLARFPHSSVKVGLEYLAFRDEVNMAKELYQLAEKSSSKHIGRRRKILISLGATQQQEILSRLIHTIASVVGASVDLVVYSTAMNMVKLPSNITVVNLFSADFMAQAVDADLVICGAGQSLLEMCYIGIPVVGLVIADNQITCGKQLAKLGVPIIDQVKNTHRVNNIAADLPSWIAKLNPELIKESTVSNPFNGGVRSAHSSAQPKDVLANKSVELIDQICTLIL